MLLKSTLGCAYGYIEVGIKYPDKSDAAKSCLVSLPASARNSTSARDDQIVMCVQKQIKYSSPSIA